MESCKLAQKPILMIQVICTTLPMYTESENRPVEGSPVAGAPFWGRAGVEGTPNGIDFGASFVTRPA